MGREAHTTRRRLHSAERRGKTPRSRRVCQQARVRESTRLGSRGSGRGGMTERGGARAGALHLRRSAGAQTARANAGQDALERERSRMAVAGPAARLSESALADGLLRSRAALTSCGCCSRSAAHHVAGGRLHARRAPAAALQVRARCSSARAQTPGESRRFAARSRAPFELRLRRQLRLTKDPMPSARNRVQPQRCSVQGVQKDFYGRIAPPQGHKAGALGLFLHSKRCAVAGSRCLRRKRACPRLHRSARTLVPALPRVLYVPAALLLKGPASVGSV